MPNQVENGKAFEYALAICYYKHLKSLGLNVLLSEDNAFKKTQDCFEKQDEKAKKSFMNASQRTIESLLILEPGLTTQKNFKDCLKIHIAPDAAGIDGDVRDVIFERAYTTPRWEIGFSAKNNHEAVKHSRLSMTIDFGLHWMGHKCSKEYFSEIEPIFKKLNQLKAQQIEWRSVQNKDDSVYVPILHAFRKEMLRLASENQDAPRHLLNYLIGNHPFYKIIKDDRFNLVIVKAFNLGGNLNKTVNRKRALARTEPIKFPSRIIELEFVPNSKTTLLMVMDEGWQVSFRIHNARTLVEPSLKFDIQLIGNPPILFTQSIFNIIS